VTARAHRAAFLASMTIGLVAAGCGSSTVFSSKHTATHAAHRAPRAAPAPVPPANALPPVNPGQPPPTPGPTGTPAAARSVGVIRAWSDALRHGDVQSAARYFAVPSVMINGTDTTGQALVIAIGDRAQAEAANESLPCGARLISTDQRGRFVNALFRLTGRPGPGGSDCGGGAGATARTNFVIDRGRIVEWIRAPDDPGDNGTPKAPQTTPSPAPAPAPAPGGPLPLV
jgi:hypothetical protein